MAQQKCIKVNPSDEIRRLQYFKRMQDQPKNDVNIVQFVHPQRGFQSLNGPDDITPKKILSPDSIFAACSLHRQ
jgi:hypothetical protein